MLILAVFEGVWECSWDLDEQTIHVHRTLSLLWHSRRMHHSLT